MAETPTDERGRRVLRTVSCATPLCYGSQLIVEDPRAENGEVAVGGCSCGALADDEQYEKWLTEQERNRDGRDPD